MALTKTELRNFFRNKMQLTFVLIFPILLLVVFAAIFGGDLEVEGQTVPMKGDLSGSTAKGRSPHGDRPFVANADQR